MTTAQAISFVRMLLDETGYEYYGDSADMNAEFITVLQQAATQKAREYWSRGDKEALRTLWTEQTVTGNPASLSFTPLFIESVRIQVSATDTSFKHTATFQPHDLWGQARMLNPTSAPTVSGRYEYTYYDDKIYHNGDPTAGVRVSYVAVPAVSSTLSTEMPLPVWCHGPICERAAEIMYEKEVQDDDRVINGYNQQKFASPIKGMLDIYGTLSAQEK